MLRIPCERDDRTGIFRVNFPFRESLRAGKFGKYFFWCVCGSVQVTNLGGIQNNLKRVSRPRSSACNRRGLIGGYSRHASETESEKRIRNILNKRCSVKLVTSRNRDYRP